ncbi:MAG: Uma2 family endonuclease [Lewinellaceae bacterium]|nr:Uma2 family endonuclease [Saprospiraceae bacterium]MCB9333701.1 Uma2 family endonuclease [Lewinellaceae bacterium]
MPSRNHGYIQGQFLFQLKFLAKNRFTCFSELSLDLANWESVPDIAVYPKMEIDFLHDEISMKEPPLTVIEILSPTQSLQELVSKAEKYFEHGVKSCWLVLLSVRNVYVFSNPTEYVVFTHKEVLKDPVLSVEMPLGEVFS